MTHEELAMEIASLGLDYEIPETKLQKRKKTSRHMSEEFRKKRSNIMKKLWSDPEFREKQLVHLRSIDHSKGHPMSTEARAKMRAVWTPERREEQSERMKQMYRDNPQLSQIKSEKMKQVIHRPWTKEEREQMSIQRKDYIWIYNDETGHETKIHKSLPIPEGYRRGRKSMSLFWQQFREQKENK